MGKISASLPQELGVQFGGTAIHLATRDFIMRAAVRELNAAMVVIRKLVIEAKEIRSIPSIRVLSGRGAESARDQVLLAIDSFLYEEFRAYEILTGVGKAPTAKQRLTTGESVELVDKKGKLRPHDFLLYLCDKLHVASN